jgi:putative ABC transport system permease protein
MISLRARSSLRFLLRHPLQLLLSVLGVALGVAVVVSIDLAIGSSRAAFRASAETVSGRTTHQVLGGATGLPDTLPARLRIQGGIRAAAPVVEGVVASPLLPGRALTLLGIDPFSESPVRPFLGEGGGLDLTALLTTPGGLILSAETAADAGVASGDPIPLRVAGEQVEGRVVGILSPTDELARRGIRDLLVMDVALAQDLLGERGRLSRVDLVLEEGARGAEVLEEVQALLPPGTRVEGVGTRTATLEGMTRAFDLNLTALSLLALVFGMFLIYNTMTFSVVQRRRLMGTLRALGVTRGELVRGVLGEAAVVGMAGAGAGVVLGVVLGQGLVGLVTRTINDLYFVVAVEGVQVSPGVLVKGAILGVGATLLASLPPAWEATSVTPGSALARSAVENRVRQLVPRAAWAGALLLAAGGGALLVPSRSIGLAFVALFAILLGMALATPAATVVLMGALRPVLARGAGILGSMAARGVVTALSRTAPAMAALVVAVSVTVGLGVMIASFRGTVVRWLDTTLQADVYVSPPAVVSNRAEGTLPAGLELRYAGVPGVAGVSTYRGREFTTPRYGVTRLVALSLHPRGEGALELVEGDPVTALGRFRREGAVLVSEPFAFRHGVVPGDTVHLPTGAGDRDFPVAGVFRDYGSDQGVIMMARSTYDAYWDDAGITSLGLFAESGVEADALVAALREVTGEGSEVQIRSNRALRELSLEVFDRTFAITAVLRGLAFIVAFIGVFSALMALQLERERELGVLRANGLTPGQVWQLVTTQTGLMGLVAGVLAMPAGVVLALVMIHVVNRRSFGWTLDMELGPALLGQSLLLAVAGAVLAGVYPAWRMSRTSPSAALREE